MNDATDFSQILEMQMDEIERPKPIPPGSYICAVVGMPRFDKSSKKQTNFVEFTFQPLQAGDDVDSDELEAMGGIGNRTLRSTFYLTPDATWRLKKFLEDLGIKGVGKSLAQAIEEAPGRQVITHVVHEPSQDGTTFFAQIRNTAPVE